MRIDKFDHFKALLEGLTKDLCQNGEENPQKSNSSQESHTCSPRCLERISSFVIEGYWFSKEVKVAEKVSDDTILTIAFTRVHLHTPMVSTSLFETVTVLILHLLYIY